ncbi:hypothetical protein BGZ80_000360 [Entomortierella chlamydospora]|uniref:GST N-terminal domain-containing protein n=1 Tax=Entomortierella chlamydospora TaxID=101097 RepID=A0A9P6MT74_9FUNG|nr:hypothetical protein BGZ79_006022 [Entomortierella chlamydospora]KAG0011891.1 hypothetical protein BGZ80_000360 [Entomortierella chlamydospora]
MTLQYQKDESTYVVKYMNLMGRAGIIRVLLHLAEAKYTNEFIPIEQVSGDKSALPFGHVPVLIEHRADGTTLELGEALAIEQYLAEKFGLLGSNPQEAAIYRSVALNIYLELYQYCFASATPIQEQIADKNSEFMMKALPQFIKCHESWLNKNGNNGHYFGSKLSYPDLVLLNWTRVLEGLGIKFEEDSPIKKLEETIRVMEEWKGQYDNFHPFKTIEP